MFDNSDRMLFPLCPSGFRLIRQENLGPRSVNLLDPSKMTGDVVPAKPPQLHSSRRSTSLEEEDIFGVPVFKWRRISNLARNVRTYVAPAPPADFHLVLGKIDRLHSETWKRQ